VFRRVLPVLTLVLALSVPAAAKTEAPQVHVIYEGQTLRMIAKRYNVTIDAICTANGIEPNTKIKPKQKLVIPVKADKDGEQTRKLVQQGKFLDKGIPAGAGPAAKAGAASVDAKEPPKAERKVVTDETFRRYVKPARRKGYVTLHATGRRWSGYAIVKGNRVSSRAHAAFKRVLYSWRTGDEREIDPRLIRLLTEVSDKFGGRPLKIASGFRENSFARESKHKSGRACDFAVEGVPNDALYAYLSTLSGVGIGYYPNSSFVHLDVRPKTTHWTDYSEPGEAPRKAAGASGGASAADPADAPDAGAHD
jgi:uncharacterized protein YcbK (DUF882 family)